MFDNVPPNLPVEPANQTPPPPPPTPSGNQPKPIVVGQPKKEPEDIFSDINVGGDDMQTAPSSQDIYSAPKKSALPLVAVIVVAIIVLGGIVFAAWYFLLRQESVPAPTSNTTQTTQPAPVQQQPEIVEQPPVTANEVTTVPPAGTNIPLPEQTEQPTTTENMPAEASTEPAVPPPPAAVITEGVDSDSDGLTDVEEALLGTNPQLADTDGDGYSDGSEVMNLYSPLAANQPLSADPSFSPATWEAKSPLNSYTWTFLRPKAWLLNGESVMQAILSTDTSARFVFSLATKADIPPGATFKTKSGLDAVRTEDRLTTYVYSGDAVIAVTYDPNGAATYEYRTLYDELVNSLHLQ